MTPRNDDISIILAKAKLNGFLPDVSNNELNFLEKEADRLFNSDMGFVKDPDRLAIGQSNMPRKMASSALIATTSGSIRLTYFTATKTEICTQIRAVSGSTAAAATPTTVKLGVYSVADNGDLTLIAATANDTTLFAAINTVYTKATLASFELEAGRRYAYAMFINTGAGLPTLTGQLFTTPLVIDEPRLSSQSPGQTDLLSTITAASLGTSSQGMYAAFLP